MAEIKWIKLMTDVFDNRKIKQIESMPDGDALIVIWFKILTLAGQINDGGLVYFTKDIPYTDQLLASQFNKPIATIQLALSTFERFEMIQIIDSLIMVSNWEKYQNIEGMERVREQTRKRVAAYRERKKELPCNATVTLRNATEEEIDIEKNKEKGITKVIPKKKFVPPTVEEVTQYCDERHNGVDAETFVDFYSSKDWMIGKNKMKDWKAAVRTWERNRKGGSPKQQKSIVELLAEAQEEGEPV